VLIARRHPDFSIAGDAKLATAVQLAAGWLLIVAGLAHAARRPGAAGALLVAAGFGWFAIEAANPEVGSPLVFTAGLLFGASAPALIVHAALAYSGGRLASRVEIAVVVAGYVVCIAVAGILTAALNDPAAHGCLNCPRNLAHLGGSVGSSDAVARDALWLVGAWSVAAVAVLAWRALRTSLALRRLAAAALAPAAAYVALVGVANAHGISRGFQSNDPTDRRLWAGQALALVALAIGVSWERVRSARMRAELAELVVELDAAPAGRGVREALASALDEPGLTLAYRSLSATGWIDADGRPASLSGAVTELAGIAAVGHRPAALQDAELVRDIARAAGPALEHERLQAELKAQLLPGSAVGGHTAMILR